MRLFLLCDLDMLQPSLPFGVAGTPARLARMLRACIAALMQILRFFASRLERGLDLDPVSEEIIRVSICQAVDSQSISVNIVLHFQKCVASVSPRNVYGMANDFVRMGDDSADHRYGYPKRERFYGSRAT